MRRSVATPIQTIPRLRSGGEGQRPPRLGTSLAYNDTKALTGSARMGRSAGLTAHYLPRRRRQVAAGSSMRPAKLPTLTNWPSHRLHQAGIATGPQLNTGRTDTARKV